MKKPFTRGSAERSPGRHGVVVVDKPRGPTSHDIVARARRAFNERRVGHAGTLDPMASGVLVVLVGEATKLAPYITANDKTYTARIALGVGTDTFDAEGTVVATSPLSDALFTELLAIAEGAPNGSLISSAIQGEIDRRGQVPPAYSAVKVDGIRSYALARAGDEVELAARSVEVKRLVVTGAGGGELPYLDVELEVTKGYYVRSLGRDLGERLGVPAHLTALRRIASGAFGLSDAHALEDLAHAELESVASAAVRAIGVARLDEAGAARVRLGQRPPEREFVELEGDGPRAWLDPSGALVAIGERIDGRCSILRGFAAQA